MTKQPEQALEQKLLFETLQRFIDRTLEPAVARPEEPMDAAALTAVLLEVEKMGLAGGAEATGLAVWDDLFGEECCERSIEMLRRVARSNVAVALVIHTRGLARAVARRASLAEDVQSAPTIAFGASFGLGRGAFARALSSASLTDEDIELLRCVYADGARRIMPVEPGFGGLVAPVWTEEDRFSWHFYRRDTLQIIEHADAHGLDELTTVQLRADGGSAAESNLSGSEAAALVGRAFFAHQTALIAISTGAVESAIDSARTFAGQRRQGGRRIAGHPAVAELFSQAQGAVDAADAALAKLATLPGDYKALRRAISLRCELQPRLVDGANATLQVFGGQGYMRDVGIEKIVRDVNTLRVLGGSPRALAMVDPAVDIGPDDDKEMHGDDSLRGHPSADHPLSVRTALKQLPLLVRPLVDYEPTDPWEADTRSLPAVLARYRRRIRDFAQRHLEPVAARADLAAHDSAEAKQLARSVLAAAGEEGLLDDMLPAPLGSTDPRILRHPLPFTASLKAEELAAVDGGLMLLISAHTLGVAPLLVSGDLAMIRRQLVPACRESRAGSPHIFAYAITEPAGGSDVEDSEGARTYRPGVVARPVEGGFRLTGRKCYISGGDIARSIVVFAALKGEGIESWTAFLVKDDDPGFDVVRTELKMGMRASGAAELEFDDVFVGHDRVVGKLRDGWALNRAILNMSRIPVGAMGVGFARAATEAAEQFVCRARLGTRRLIDYQDVQLDLADMRATTRAARSMVWAAASRTQAIQREASAVKFYATDAAMDVCTRAMDLLGNHAMLHHNRVEKAYRDARLTQIFEGTNQLNRLAVIEDNQQRLLAMSRRLEPEDL